MSLSEEFINKYTVEATANSAAISGSVRPDAFIAGTVVDFGTTLWNSVVSIPKLIGVDTDSARVGTYDVLKTVNNDWATYYQENKDSIETASFVAGLLLPGGLAMKGMKALQAGKIGFYPSAIADTAQVARRQSLVTMMEGGGQATADFRRLKWQILSSDAAQQFGQAAGTELAIIATMNQHAYMEDYLKDPLKNFTIGLAVGGVLGSGIGQIIMRNTLAKELNAVSSAANRVVGGAVSPIPAGISDVDKVQRYAQNAEQLRHIAEESSGYNVYTRELATKAATYYEGRAGQYMEKGTVFSEELKGADDAMKQLAKNVILDPLSFGANQVGIAKWTEADLISPTGFVRQRFSLTGNQTLRKAFLSTLEAVAPDGNHFDVLDKIPAYRILQAGAQSKMSLLNTRALQDFVPDWERIMKKESTVYYSPHFEAYIPQADAKQFTRAVDTGRTEAKVVMVGKLHDDFESKVRNRAAGTAIADSYWIDTLASVSKFAASKSVYMAADDLAVAQAWISRIKGLKEGEEAPRLFLSKYSDNATQTEMRLGGKEYTVEQLEDYVLTEKQKLVRTLAAGGASFHEISIRANIPLASLERHLIGGVPLKQIGDAMSYTNPADIGTKYLAPTSRMLSLTTNEKKISSLSFRAADGSAKLDSKYIQLQNQELMDTIIASSKSTIAKEVQQALNADPIPWEILREGIQNVTNENAGSFLVSSADFATRRMGELSDIATAQGQTWTGIVNNVTKAQLTGLSTRIRAQTLTQAGLNEFNEVVNLLAGVSGYRNISDDGVLYRLIPGDKGKLVEQAITKADGSAIQLSDSMKGVLFEMKKVSEEQRNLKNTLNNIQGFKDINDLGLHIPSFNPNNKFISYVIAKQANTAESRVQLLVGKTAEELATKEAAWLAQHGRNSPHFDLVTKSQQEAYNFWRGRLDPMDMDYADINKFHSGASKQFDTPVTDDYAATIVENLHSRIIHYSKQLQQMYLSDIMENLDRMSELNRLHTKSQPLKDRALATVDAPDAARAFKNILLGNDQLDNHATWQSVNNGFANMVEYGSGKVTQALNNFRGLDTGTRMLKEGEWKKLAGQLEQAGLRNPFASFNDYITAGKAGGGGMTLEQRTAANVVERLRVDDVARRLGVSAPRAEDIISAGNSVLATMALRVMEVGHATVSMLSWPIMAMPELMRNMPKTYLGNALGEGVGVAYPARVLYDGMRFRHSDAAKPLIDRWIKQGFGESIVSEATKLNQEILQGNKGSLAFINRTINDPNGLVKTLSTPSDFAEKETRLMALSVGYQAAKIAYPTISDQGADLFAKAFMARAIGNYYSGQRPAMFQGTFGVAIGLFQTYMLSWVQSAFRSIEGGHHKALASQMLSQMGLFGMSSLPLYDLFSKTIGENFSDKHFDLTTGTYRALPDQLAEFAVFGLPASIGLGLYTRGDMQPRLPFVQPNPLDTIATINAARQLYGATAGTITKTLDANGMQAKTRALLEGLSAQSLSRPLARIVELAPMYDESKGTWEAVGSITRGGNTVATSDQVWSVPGVMSRLMTSRSAEEQIKREVDYLSTYYGSLDFENRKATTYALKVGIRAGTLTPERVEGIAAQYLRTGSATGWKAALNEAIATSEGGINYKLHERIKPDSPFSRMIDESY